jgi:hypothetical protein
VFIFALKPKVEEIEQDSEESEKEERKPQSKKQKVRGAVVKKEDVKGKAKVKHFEEVEQPEETRPIEKPTRKKVVATQKYGNEEGEEKELEAVTFLNPAAQKSSKDQVIHANHFGLPLPEEATSSGMSERWKTVSD